MKNEREREDVICRRHGWDYDDGREDVEDKNKTGNALDWF